MHSKDYDMINRNPYPVRFHCGPTRLLAELRQKAVHGEQSSGTEGLRAMAMAVGLRSNLVMRIESSGAMTTVLLLGDPGAFASEILNF